MRALYRYSMETDLRPTLLRQVRLPTVSGRVCRSLCWRSRNTICRQFPISDITRVVAWEGGQGKTEIYNTQLQTHYMDLLYNMLHVSCKLNVKTTYKRQNTGVWLFIRRVCGVYRMCITWQILCLRHTVSHVYLLLTPPTFLGVAFVLWLPTHLYGGSCEGDF